VQKWRFLRSISGQFERSDFFNTIGQFLPFATVRFGLSIFTNVELWEY